MFFSFDGLDGAGKTTQVALFCQWLAAAGYDVVTCRDPGSTPLGEAVRDLLLKSDTLAIGLTSEMLLYMAARAQLVEEVIRPALDAGRIVVSDRFLLSNVVYQGHAGGLDPEELWRIGQTATGGLLPAVSFVLDLEPQAAARRLRRNLDRMEQRGPEYRAALRRGFLAEAARRPHDVVVIDAAQSVEAVQAEIRAEAQKRLAAKPGPAAPSSKGSP